MNHDLASFSSKDLVLRAVPAAAVFLMLLLGPSPGIDTAFVRHHARRAPAR